MGKILLVSILPSSRKRLVELQSQEIALTELFNWSTWPLGILSIESYIKKSHPQLSVQIVDLNRTFLKRINACADYKEGLKEITDNYTEFLTKEIIDICQQEQVDIIGLSALFDISLSSLLLVAEEARKAAPNTLIIAGGYPCTNFAADIIANNPAIDAICLGEGEIPFAELVTAEDKKEYLDTSPYFVTKKHTGNTKGFVLDINDIPRLNYDDYIAQYGEEVIREYVNVLNGGKGAFGTEGIVMTTRGCPFTCVFCAAHSIHGRSMRYLSMERVKEEIDYWIDNYNVATINIIDDHFLADVNRAIEVIDYICGRGRTVFFANTLSFVPVTKEFVDCLVRNRIKDIHFALESGSARVLREIMNKPITLKRADEVLAMFKGTGIFVKIALLVGFPDETVEDVEEALQYLRKAEYHWATISNLIPISGSVVYKQIVEDSGTEYKMDNANVFAAGYANPETVAYMLGDIKYTMNLDINFVHNPYMRMEEYALAAGRFEAILRSYPNHAFAHYYLAKCLEKLGEDGTEHYRQFHQLVEKSEMWRKYATHFGLE
ncbi:Fe-S oxidoreductase [Desulfitobacterium sp. LBE]|uniref:B12-binding domain-containing radical SAM protein n=1 Tax=Desulfitobacterium sp. LBE TaxID=884086 RepID=UPI0011994BE5|nr:radical SAM protein [Desulfitobacterium sp. LBE]TWH60042.1 Fe-S oxidoreductase [Desulfitobacterium sp. LBE]